MRMLSKETVLEALKDVIDPEIGLSLVDMNLIRDIKVDGDVVKIKMTLTMPGCPLAGFLMEQVKQRAEKIEGISKAEVELVWD